MSAPGLEVDAPAPRVWTVGALCRAIADALESRFNPVAVQGEISGFSRAASGHCYFSIKDSQGQLRCAMFRRAASLLDFNPRDGELVELRGRLGVYEARGDLQFIVEGMRRAGQGALFEQFLRLKAKLEAEGLFDAARKRPLPLRPRGIGLVTSPGAAALHDVVTALRRRVPHIPVTLVPALVQGAAAPASIVAALSKLYQRIEAGQAQAADFSMNPAVDVILLVRGGGSIEDLWAFNDEAVARAVVQSPVPLVSGVGHETDFTIADFCADVRAPTPTAAAELVSAPRDVWLGALQLLEERLQQAALRRLDAGAQQVDWLAARLGRPSARLAEELRTLQRWGDRLQHQARLQIERQQLRVQGASRELARALRERLQRDEQRLAKHGVRLEMLSPQRVLERGYALLSDAEGRPVTQAAGVRVGQGLRAQLVDGALDLTVAHPRLL
ncbi:MAG: exodeoxyribonuclease VII large subunit [Burkholderiaceae bacterium]